MEKSFLSETTILVLLSYDSSVFEIRSFKNFSGSQGWIGYKKTGSGNSVISSPLSEFRSESPNFFFGKILDKKMILLLTMGDVLNRINFLRRTDIFVGRFFVYSSIEKLKTELGPLSVERFEHEFLYLCIYK